MNRNGAASIVLVFAVLCLTIFAVVSFVPALREEALIERETAHVTAFYTADTQAEIILAEILAQINDSGITPDEVGGTPVYSEFDMGVLYERVWFAYPINDIFELYVSVMIDIDLDYTVLAWQVVQTGAWQADEGMVVWTPDEFTFGW
jgi:hypothetical protein